MECDRTVDLATIRIGHHSACAAVRASGREERYRNVDRHRCGNRPGIRRLFLGLCSLAAHLPHDDFEPQSTHDLKERA